MEKLDSIALGAVGLNEVMDWIQSSDLKSWL